jgi:hypothetical protein
MSTPDTLRDLHQDLGIRPVNPARYGSTRSILVPEWFPKAVQGASKLVWGWGRGWTPIALSPSSQTCLGPGIHLDALGPRWLDGLAPRPVRTRRPQKTASDFIPDAKCQLPSREVLLSPVCAPLFSFKSTSTLHSEKFEPVSPGDTDPSRSCRE